MEPERNHMTEEGNMPETLTHVTAPEPPRWGPATYSFTGEESRVGDSISSKLSSKERASISPSIEDPKEFIHVRKKEGGEGIEAKHCILFLFL